jgi:hypothetical protein
VGCRALPTTHYYLLELAPAPEPAGGAPAEGLHVGVHEPLVLAPYDQERIAYRPVGAAQEIAFYHYHRWSAPPARLAQTAIAQALDRLAGIRAEPARAGTAYDLLLRPTILRLVELDSGTAIEAGLDLRWTATTADGASRGGGELSLAEPVASPTVDDVVAGFATAFERAAAEIGRALLAERGRDDR